MGIFQDSKVFDSNRFRTGLVLCFLVLPVSIMVSILYRNSMFHLSGFLSGNAQSSSGSSSDFSGPAISPTGALESRNDPGQDSRIVETSDSRNAKVLNGTSNPEVRNDSSEPNNSKLLDRLFSPELDERSCLSRYKSTLYRKPSPHKPSPYLILKLREYEDHHKRCGPNTKSYNQSLRRLKTRHKTSSATCKYAVWLPANGLGNRMISMASTFLYALLTNRVLLVDHGMDMADLFCEPFPDTSWLLPHSFPLQNHHKMRYSQSFGRMAKDGILNTSTELLPSYLYMNLDHSKYYLDKKLFYCDKTEALLGNVTWLMMLSDQYFTPYFFLSRSYRKEVSKMFPEKETAFHQLGSYLFSPTNQVWGLITRFYNAYLAKADQRVGLQIRVFDRAKTPFQTVLDQLLNCTLKERILPEVGIQKPVDSQSRTENKTSKAILVTSLHYDFYVNLSNVYWTRPTITGEVVGVYQPSHEEFQHFGGNNMHNMKAWAEIYLLSLTDMLVTSSRSTFGYAAQALGGLKPWILFKTDGKNVRNPPCTRDLSMEPCFHFPPAYDCYAEAKVDGGNLLPYLRHCQDLKKGVKLLPYHNEH